MPPAMPDMPAMPEMGGDDVVVDDAEIQGVGAYATGENSSYTAGDGTTFVNNFEEEDDATEVEFDDGKLAVQTYNWDPTVGSERPEESESESESEETCEEEEDCGCCSQDVCPDLTYYDE